MESKINLKIKSQPIKGGKVLRKCFNDASGNTLEDWLK